MMSNDKEILYKGLTVSGACSSPDEKAELLLDQIIQKSEIKFSEEKVEQELRLEMAGFMQAMRYRAMGGDHQLEEMDMDEWMEKIRNEIIRDHQVEIILQTVIQKEHLSVSSDELAQAARELAEKEHTTLEMVQRFMGEDYALLKKDVLNRKAKAFIVNNACFYEKTH